MTKTQKIILLLTGMIALGSCMPLGVVEINVNNYPLNRKTDEPDSKISTPIQSEPQSTVTISEKSNCHEIQLPQPAVVKELPPNIREIIQNDPDKGLILMAEQIAALRKAYIEYKANVNISYLDYKRSCKK